MTYTSNIVWKCRFYKLPNTSAFDITPAIRYVEQLSQANDRYRGLCISWGRRGVSLMFTVLNPELEKFEHEERVINVGGKDIAISSRISYAIMKTYNSLSEIDRKEFREIGVAITGIIEGDEK